MKKSYIVVAFCIIGGALIFSLVSFALTKSSKQVSGTPTEISQTPSPFVSQNPTLQQQPKEFTMTSYYEMTDGKASAHFSLNDIRVKKGDLVRITITNTRGTHDFVIDEFGVRQETPLNQPVTVEFAADTVGQFVYYCSKMNHRAMGQWGTLVVEE